MESELIAWLRHRLPGDPRLIVAPGDDAAVLRTTGPVVATVDMLMDRVDFEVGVVDPRRIGHKCLAVNLSDLAAMAARPLAALVAIALPRAGGLRLAQELYEGMIPLAEQHNIVLAGGDTNSWDGPLVVSVTALGEAPSGGALLRSGAKVGDRLLVSGPLGGSILGKHLDFRPRIAEASYWNSHYALHAGIDISDGLLSEAAHLARESNCGVLLDFAAIPIAAAAEELSKRDGISPLEHALADGEDFELLLSAGADETARMLADRSSPLALSAIGTFVSEPGLWKLTGGGTREAIDPRGWEHRFD